MGKISTSDTGQRSRFSGSSHIAGQVTEWHAEVCRFFRDDWSRLRTLLLELQEQTWKRDEIPTDETNELSEAVNQEERVVETSAKSPPAAPEMTADPLCELAEKISDRLRAVAETEG